ncbi:hypothetical protein BDF21DRAFT_107062 [Thamnidium elegans]|nr:hypothetical protein BDF21DRAFT_107062 [Thamnidium elegans]
MNTFVSKDINKPIKIGASNGKRLCRNVIIHGFCKFQDKGCEFNHENEKSFSTKHGRFSW